MKAYVEMAPDHGHKAQVIDVADFDRLGEFDAIFLRLDTNVTGLPFAMSRAAWGLGLRVVDDPVSMLTCMNKAHVQGILEQEGVPTPETLLITRAGRAHLDPAALFEDLGRPIVCKAPSGAFSSSVEKAEDETELVELVRRFGQRSDVVLLQRYTPSRFDWRIGILCDRVLYAARYHIPKGAWRIHDTPEGAQRKEWARVERVPLGEVPDAVLDLAKRATKLIGTGLYGADIKELEDGRAVVIEINDNPNIDWDAELPAGSPVFGDIVDLIAREGPKA